MQYAHRIIHFCHIFGWDPFDEFILSFYGEINWKKHLLKQKSNFQELLPTSSQDLLVYKNFVRAPFQLDIYLFFRFLTSSF